MLWQTSLQLFSPFTAALITTLIGIYSWQQRKVSGAAPLARLLLVVTMWQLASGVAVVCDTPEAAYFWHRVSFSAIALIPTAALIFILQFSGRTDLLPPERLLGLLIFPLLTILIIWTNSLHHGFIRHYAFAWSDGRIILTEWQGGIWFLWHSIYNFLIATISIGVIGWSAFRAPQPFRGQMSTILIWGCLSLIFALPLTLFPYSPQSIVASLLPTLNSIGFAWAVFRFRLFNLSPVARDLLVEAMNDGMLILDLYGRIVDVNHALEMMSGLRRSKLIGQEITSLPAPWDHIEQQVEIFLGQERQLHIQTMPLIDRRKQNQGKLIIIRDITALKLMETLEKRVAARTRDLSTLYEVASLIGRSLDLQEVLNGCLALLNKANDGAGGLILLQEENASWQITAAYGDLPALVLQGEPVSWWRQIASGGEALLVHDLASSIWAERLFPGGWSFPTLAASPIQPGNQLGVMVIFGLRRAQFNVEDLGLLTTVSEQASIAIENDRLRQQQQIAAVLIERQRLARDLHDSVTQLLYSQLLFARAAKRSQHSGDFTRSGEFLTRLDDAAQQALREMRLLIYQLRPADLAEIGLAEALRRRLETVEQRAGVAVDLQTDEHLELPDQVQADLYSIAEECLNNALKHAAASQVTITLRAAETQLEMTIADNGRGFDPTRIRAGLGLANMRERATLLGGDLAINSAPGQGTHLRLRLQLKS
jgi:signal transduction histidine kinase